MGSRKQDHGENPTSVGQLRTAQDSDSDSAQLAEGFVRTAPLDTGDAEQPEVASPPGRNASSTEAWLPAGSGSNQLSTRAQEQRQTHTNEVGPRGDAVPLWIDRAIVALAIVLVALLLKVLFGI
jgi:ubiquitin-conjugating enzyme E2 J1